MQEENARKIATPPSRGNGLECKCRSCEGTATHPWEVAKSRTYRVSTNASSSDEKNNAKQIAVNYTTSARFPVELGAGWKKISAFPKRVSQRQNYREQFVK
jgi:hypothetical protein